MEEPPPMVCYSRGVMGSLVDKLTDAKKTHPKVDPLLQDLKSLREDLVNKFDSGRATHKQVKGWMKRNRQLVYDIEDWIDLNLDESETEFEEQIDEFTAKIKEARDCWERYDLARKAAICDADFVDVVPRKKVLVDPQLLWEKKGILIGIDGPRKKLEEHLQDTQKKRKVVSVLGMDGLGKTALAAKVYAELNWQFDCHASVTVGGKSPITALMDVFLQVNPEMAGHDTSASLNEHEVIRQLWEFLKNKRYFIFMDEIRNTHDWGVFNCALPNNDLRSRILTTTHIKDVAMSCSVHPTDVIHEMKGLDEDRSRRLLLDMMPAQTEHTSMDFGKNCDDMLKLCCGLPLAIIVMSGLLALKYADLGPLGKHLSMLDQYSTSDGIGKVLDICFADLSLPMKACFLYLSTFPENCTIKKDCLIRRWVAEGFIPGIGQASMWETGESYFNELICRKLICPVFDDYNDYQAVVCTVHPVIHDFILSMSRQEDFHTAAAELISGPFPYGTIRRFSVNCSRQENNEAKTLKSSAIHLSRVRSLTVFGDAGRLLDLSAFKHVRVLDLEDTKTLDDEQLEQIGFFPLLIYLGLAGTNVAKLPQQIVELEHLSTLDLRRTSVMELPALGDTELASVLADGLIIPRGIGEMKHLEELSTVSILPDDAALLVKSRLLRLLGVTFSFMYTATRANQQRVKCFLEEVRKSNLHSFLLDDYPCYLVNVLVECWGHKGPHNLRKFELRISNCLQVVPQKMASLLVLTHLHIRVREVHAQCVNALGSLPNLVLLKIFSGEGTREWLAIKSKDGFPCLKVFWLSSYFLGMGLHFEEGAMPHLQRLRIEFHARKTKFTDRNFDFGIQHLCNLLQIRAIIHCRHATDPEAKAAEAAIRGQISRIHDNPLPIYGGDLLPRKEATKEAASSSSVNIRISILPESSPHLPLPGPISFVMEDPMVSASTGAMNSVLTKLTTVMGEQYAVVTGTDEQEMILRDELQVMDALLKQLSNTPDLNIKMKECRDQMRELTYDIDDSIDDLMVGSVNVKDSSGSTEKRVTPRDFIDQIQKLNAHVEEEDLPSMVRKTERRNFGPSHMPREQWLFYFYCDNRIERDEPSEEWLRKSYAALPPDMKTCLLYLSCLPANHEIKKDRLIRRWAAEGFLPKRSVEGWWETGESYFFELINRKLIEPVFDDNYWVLFRDPYNKIDGPPTGFRVGASVHEFITSLSSEENFVKSGQHGVFWRLSCHPSYKEEEKLMVLLKEQKSCKVRSLTLEGQLGRRGIPSLSNFKHLRVLDLEDIKALKYENLHSIERLSLLRYLGLAGTEIEWLPPMILALEHLETLDVRRTGVTELPAFKSTNLVSLLADKIKLSEGWGDMQTLQVLSKILSVSGHMLAKVVRQSKQLMTLGVRIDARDSEHKRTGLRDLLDAIRNSNIRYLFLEDWSGPVLDILLDCWGHQRPLHLQKLQLQLYETLPKVPQNMSHSLIAIDLTYLRISVKRVDTEGLQILGDLPNLVALTLETRKMTERSIISKNGFRCLGVFFCDCSGMGLQFEAGAMSQLRRLGLEFNVKETESEFGDIDFGIKFLSCLVRVHATINCNGSKPASVEALEAAVRYQVSQNPNNPVLVIQRREEYMMVGDTVTDEVHTSSYVKDLEDKEKQWMS